MTKLETIRFTTAYIALLQDIVKADDDPLTFMEKNMQEKKISEHGVKWNSMYSQLHFKNT